MRSVNGFTGRNPACCKPLFYYVQKFQKKNWEETFWMVRHGHSFFFAAPCKSRGGIFLRCYKTITGTTSSLGALDISTSNAAPIDAVKKCRHKKENACWRPTCRKKKKLGLCIFVSKMNWFDFAVYSRPFSGRLLFELLCTLRSGLVSLSFFQACQETQWERTHPSNRKLAQHAGEQVFFFFFSFQGFRV